MGSRANQCEERDRLSWNVISVNPSKELESLKIVSGSKHCLQMDFVRLRMEKSCSLLIHFKKGTPALANEIKEASAGNDVVAMVEAMKKAVI
ncbi:hypothetical protein C5167_035110 [Papaver somniferum]|uniref:Uncharacterized protein n=1 Tax=Papaver somniferum TaxID=3469 RepID=A0A4Y7KI88_PAPSO|nr:hypothetical protein C5167_035110 [Papaver somniferum]